MPAFLPNVSAQILDAFQSGALLGVQQNRNWLHAGDLANRLNTHPGRSIVPPDQEGDPQRATL